MKKKIIVAAVAAAVAAPMFAMADATVYGKVRVATQYHDRKSPNTDAWGLQDHTSRLGIKGSEDLGNGLKAIYKMEFGVDVGDGFGKSSFWSQRNSYVGLAGGWGTVLAGRHDTPHKMSTGKLDFFGDTAADYDAADAKGVNFFEDLRVDGVIAYVSPNLSGFTLSGALIQTDVDENGNNPDADDFVSAYSVAGQYANGPWFAALAYEHLDTDSLGLTTGASNDKKWRVGLGILGWNNFSASAIYEDHSNDGGNSDADSKVWQIQLAYDFGNNRVKGMYGDFDDKSVVDNDFSAWAIGLQHNMSKRTSAEVLYRNKDADVNAGLTNYDDNVFALQLNHAF